MYEGNSRAFCGSWSGPVTSMGPLTDILAHVVFYEWGRWGRLFKGAERVPQNTEMGLLALFLSQWAQSVFVCVCIAGVYVCACVDSSDLVCFVLLEPQV